MNTRWCSRNLLGISVILSSFLMVSVFAAIVSGNPVFGQLWKARQPDGSFVDVRVWGDEYYQVVESVDGYTLIRHPGTNVICYAGLSADGDGLESTGIRAGSANPAGLGLPRHIRINRTARQEAVRKAREAAGVDVSTVSRPGEAATMLRHLVSGNIQGLCLLVDFSDSVATIPRNDAESFCNQVGYTGFWNNGSVRDYFFDVSNGNLTYTNWVSPVYVRAPQPFTYYDDPNDCHGERARELIKHILDDMEADGFDFSHYDADNDGRIDALNLFYAGTTTCLWACGMWPHSGELSWSADGVQTSGYQITGMGTGLSLGTFCHENGHMVCKWRDLYDYDNNDPNLDPSEYSSGVGGFCLMGSGGQGTNPVEPCAYLKYKAGWGSLTTIVARQFGISVPASSTNTVYKFDHPSLSTEYYLIENRQRTGRDSWIPDRGLAIWHIDENGDSNANEMLPNSHYIVTLVQADGQWDLEHNLGSGDSNDLWASPDFTACTPCTDPNTDWWDGSSSGLMFTNISASGATMTFDFSPLDEPPVAQCKTYTAIAGESCCSRVGLDNINDGSYDPNGEGDIDSLCITAVDGSAVDCGENVAVCGDGSHTVTITITDLCGHTATCDASVRVIDVTPPDITVTLNRDVLWPPNHNMADISATVEVTDNCDPDPTFILSKITSDEPENGKGDGNTGQDVHGASYQTDDTEFQLRSERSGRGEGRVYTIVYEGADDAGNTASDTAYVRVPHDHSGWALASEGFDSKGTGFETFTERFILIIPSRAEEDGTDVNGGPVGLTGIFDATLLDLRNTYVGNEKGVVTPEASTVIDANGDGLKDIALEYSKNAVSAFIEKSEDIEEDRVATKSHCGPLGLHYTSAEGVDYLVPNIFGLGSPVPLDRNRESERPKILQQLCGENRIESIPNAIALFPSYPNPFNPLCTIRYNIAHASTVSLQVFDVSGSPVRTLVNSWREPGVYSEVWDGRADDGGALPSGVYFYRLEAGDFMATREMVLLR